MKNEKEMYAKITGLTDEMDIKKEVLVMQDNNINKIISNALQVNKDIISKNIKPIITQIKKTLESNKESIVQANSIDKKNNNGFIIDFNIINNIFSNLEKENVFYGDVTLSQRDQRKKR